MAVVPPERTKVFISYSPQDAKHLKRLRVYLSQYEQIEEWDDTKIVPGTIRPKEIERAIAEAKVAILLVSADFLISKENELPFLLAAAKKEEVTILPVILGPCEIGLSDLSQIQAVNHPPSKPLIKMSGQDQEETWAKVAQAAAQTVLER